MPNITVSDSITLTESIYSLPIDYLQPALPTYDGQGGWLFNSIDFQILTKSDGWNQGQTERLNEYQEGINKGMKYVALAVPYDNLTKYTNYVADARTKGLKIIHRSHWNAWEGDNSVGNIATITSLTSSGTKATCVTQTAHGLQSGDTVSMNGMNETTYRGEFPVEVVDSVTFNYYLSTTASSPATGNVGWRYGRQTYLRKTKKFIEDNSTLFQAGDMFAVCVEAQQAANQGCQFFTQGTTTFSYTLYNQFLKDQVSYANAAFATIGLAHQVYTFPISLGLSNLNLAGQTLDSGDQGNSNGLANSDIVTYFGGFLTIDHYLSDTYFDTDLYGTKYASDLEKIHTAFPSVRIMIGEWGHHTTTNTTDTEQDNVYNDVVSTALQQKSYLIGVSFWNHLGQLSSSLWTDNSGTIVPGGRLATRQVLRAFSTPNAAFETIGVNNSVTVSESVSLTINSLGRTISLSESVTLTESKTVAIVAGSPTLAITVNEIIGTADIVRRYDDNIYLTENVVVSLSSLVLSVNKSESISVTDTIPDQNGELILASESVNTAKTSFINVSESKTVSENTTLSGVPDPNISDSTILSEAYLVVIFIDFSISILHSVAVSENISIQLSNLQVNVSDTVTITESVNLLQVNFDKSVTATDDITVTENPSLVTGGTSEISVSDIVFVTDNLTNIFTGTFIIEVVVSDNIQLTDSSQPTVISSLLWSTPSTSPTDWSQVSRNGTDWTPDPLNEGDV